ncbi:unnamed protein product [Trichogramma brassicae]|uniref:C2H2-type domain-containing protein n=1 Tax=Trichogramma brassicae TaxID=86971 RepID=A0A6H5IV38_9HYME|nr:unnamed protein product [Trichogramma brassicae]
MEFSRLLLSRRRRSSPSPRKIAAATAAADEREINSLRARISLCRTELQHFVKYVEGLQLNNSNNSNNDDDGDDDDAAAAAAETSSSANGTNRRCKRPPPAHQIQEMSMWSTYAEGVWNLYFGLNVQLTELTLVASPAIDEVRYGYFTAASQLERELKLNGMEHRPSARNFVTHEFAHADAFAKAAADLKRINGASYQLQLAEKQLYSFHDYVADLSAVYKSGQRIENESIAMLDTRRREARRVFDQLFELYLRWADDGYELHNDIGYIRTIYFAADVRANELYDRHLCNSISTNFENSVNLKTTLERKKSQNESTYNYKMSRLYTLVNTIHKSIKPYECEICYEAFGLENHVDAVHYNGNPFECEICCKSFSLEDDLKRHKNEVHDHSKVFECDICKNSFGLKSILKSHIGAVHNRSKLFESTSPAWRTSTWSASTASATSSRNFLERGRVDPNCVWRETGETPLHLVLADRYRQHQLVESLLRAGADLLLANKYGSTPLRIMCKTHHDQDLIKLLIEFKIDARTKLASEVLHMALSYGRISLVDWLLRKCVDPSLASKAGSTSLHVVCDKAFSVDRPANFP